jgi:hypothetical protein
VEAVSQALGKVPSRQFPIEIFLFDQEMDFVEALPRVQPPPNAQPPTAQPPFGNATTRNDAQLNKSAYLLRGPDRIFIIAKDKSPDDIANDVAHALGHVLFERYVAWRPFWLAEGVAEYVRKIGRGADTKAIGEQDAFSAADMLTIVPSANYNDNDPPTPFRAESYRLFRLLLEKDQDTLKQYVAALRKPSEKPSKFPIDGDAIDSPLKSYVETPLKLPPATPAIKSSEADAARLAIHRGDLLLASDRFTDASRYYNADSKEARAARATSHGFRDPLSRPFGLWIVQRASFPKTGWFSITSAPWKFRKGRMWIRKLLHWNEPPSCSR